MKTRRHILIVDDEELWGDIIKSPLEKVGFNCITCKSYVDALKELEETTPSVLVLDLNLGNNEFNENGWEGWKLAEAAKKRHVPLIIVSGYPQDDKISRAFRDFNVIDFFAKSHFNEREPVFVLRIQEAMEKARRRHIGGQKNREKVKTLDTGLIFSSASKEKIQVTKNHVFISYSHKDQKWLDKLNTGLKVLVRNNLIAVWDDTKIKSGANWKTEIKKALSLAKVAVLLVTPDFLASDFIVDNELPSLLKAAEKRGLVILWIAIKASLYDETPIADFQAANDPAKPLAGLKPSHQEQVLVEICKRVKEAVQE